MRKQGLILLEKLYKMHRFHSCPEMDEALNIMSNFYDGIIDSYDHSYGTSWEIPPNYSVDYAFLETEDSLLIDSYKDSPMFLIGYSQSIDKLITMEELKDHILTDEKRPNDYIFNFRYQYRHWEKNWSISLPWNKLKTLDKNKTYHISIKTRFNKKPLNQFVTANLNHCLLRTLPSTLPNFFNLSGKFESILK